MTAGVPADLLIGDDHIQVKAALVAYLGGGNAALVFHRIKYRTQHVSYSYPRDGLQWWKAKEKKIGAEVGLTESQVNTAVKNLLKRGAIRKEAHSYPDQTWSYAVVIAESGDSRIGGERGLKSPDSKAEISGLQGGDLPIPPLAEEREEAEEALLSDAGASDRVLFPRDWRPSQAHMDKAASLHLDVVREYQRFRTHSERRHRRLKNWNAGFTNWLRKQAEFNQEALGSSGKPTTVDHGREVDRMLAAEESQQLAVTR